MDFARLRRAWSGDGGRILLRATTLLLIAAAWLSTLPTDIVIANDPLPDPTGTFSGILQLLDDSGEFVVAWHTWGVTHAPGYPLLSLVANLGTRLLDPLRLYPATAAHLLSFFFALGALVLMVWPLHRLDGSGTAVAAAYLLPAFGILVWLYAVVAEAYAFGLLLAFAALTLAWETGREPTRRKLWLLGLLFGLAVGHHRTLVFLAPALWAAIWPARRLGWRAWLGALALAAASLLVYLYLPLVAWAGSPWVYGRSPTTWAGFSDAFFAREYSARLAPPTTWPEIVAALDGRLRFLAQEMTLPGLLAGLTGLLLALAHAQTRHLGGVLLLAFCAYWLAPVSQGLLIRSYMMILVASLTLAVAWGAGLIALGHWQRWLSFGGMLLTVAIALNAWRDHHDYILFHTKDEMGRQIIAAASELPEERPLVGDVWGPRFFPLAFGKWVSGELAHIHLLDLRADLSGLPAETPPLLFVNQHTMYAIAPDRWREKYGPSVSFNSQGAQMIAIRPTAVIAPIDPHPLAATPEIQLLRATATLSADGALLVELLWQATQPPARDYSVFVHVTDRAQILGPEDLLAQGDRLHPVAGFYPTSAWRAGEQVQDNYLILLPTDRAAQKVVVGLYTVAADGRFTNYLSYEMPINQHLLSRLSRPPGQFVGPDGAETRPFIATKIRPRHLTLTILRIAELKGNYLG